MKKLITAKHVEQIQAIDRMANDLEAALELLRDDLYARSGTCEGDAHNDQDRIDAENILDDIDEASSSLSHAINKLDRANNESVDFYLRTTAK